ncbi:MAG TPA: TetR/AcrR family transcriptional regulator [Solirubrobacteraceae bacterium]|nr:TetR/AcrR family transcriptional regulator [Solirubrobacteraceae bacterium]
MATTAQCDDDPQQGRTGDRRAQDHRDRLIAALASAIEEQGFRATTVADIVRIARTSRRTFYEHFADREACFLALFEQTSNASMDDLAAAVRPGDPPERQIESALDAYLESVTERPALHLSFVRELPGLGPEGAARQRGVIERFASLLVALVEAGRNAHPELEARPLHPDIAVIIVGGLRELLVIAAEQGRPVRELRRSAGDAVRALLDATVL